LKLVLVLAVMGFASGCAVNRASATVDPATNLERIKSVHVVKLPKDERAVNVLIADKLKARGLKVTTGPEKVEGVDATVTYSDRWMWDITMYMLELTIALRDPKSDFPMATGNSYHTSLTRKSPKEMVDEVVDNIFNKGKK
jgi:hypothetical protein